MFAKVENEQIIKFPYTIQELRADFPNVSFPANTPPSVLAQYGLVSVLIEDVPAHNVATHKVKKKDPVKLNGQWISQWEVIQHEHDRAASNIRSQRNTKLSETDWTQVKDIPEEVSQAWGAYRQALRDIPQQEGFPFNVVWPEAPTS